MITDKKEVFLAAAGTDRGGGERSSSSRAGNRDQPSPGKIKIRNFLCRPISEPLISVARQEEAERRKEKEAGDEEEGEGTAVRPILSRDEAEDEEKKAEEEEEEKPTRDDAKTA